MDSEPASVYATSIQFYYSNHDRLSASHVLM